MSPCRGLEKELLLPHLQRQNAVERITGGRISNGQSCRSKDEAVSLGDQRTREFGNEQAVWKELDEAHVLGVTMTGHFTS